MADAIIALTSNLAINRTKAQRIKPKEESKSKEEPQRIEFKEEWFDPDSGEVPDVEAIAEDIDGKKIELK